MRTLAKNLLEFLFISGLIAVGIMVLPWVAWRALTRPRLWREPTTSGRGGYYDHPS